MFPMFICDFISYSLKGVSAAPEWPDQVLQRDGHTHTWGWLGAREGTQVCTGTYRKGLNCYLSGQTNMCLQFVSLRSWSKRTFDVFIAQPDVH